MRQIYVYTDSRSAITKLRSILNKTKRREILKEKCQSACEAAGVPTNRNIPNPILDYPTRWNFTHDKIGFGLKLITYCALLSPS